MLQIVTAFNRITVKPLSDKFPIAPPKWVLTMIIIVQRSASAFQITLTCAQEQDVIMAIPCLDPIHSQATDVGRLACTDKQRTATHRMHGLRHYGMTSHE